MKNSLKIERQIGNTGVKVAAVGLGAMPLSLSSRPHESEAIKVIHAAVDQGVNLIDTADAYCLDENDVGHNEKLIAKALQNHPDKKNIVVATKGGCTRPGGDWAVNGDPAYLRRACERSLKHLNTETIFLYQLHAPDPKWFEDSVGELAKLKNEGKILHIGLSNVNTGQIQLALKITRVESVQNRFNPFEQEDLHNGVIELCSRENLTYIAHSPVGGHMGHVKRAVHPQLKKLAGKYNATPYQIMLRWHLYKGECVLPIPGASKIKSVTSSAQALSLTLDPADIRSTDSINII